jgi:hypothetical protein
VKQDGAGNQLLVCHDCLGSVKTKREDANAANHIYPGGVTSEDICTCCAEGGSGSIELFCCDDCTRAYCQSCCDVLLSARQLRQMQENESWVCCHCLPSPSGSSPSGKNRKQLLSQKPKGGNKAKSNKSKDKPLKLTTGNVTGKVDDNWVVEAQSPKDKKKTLGVVKYMAAYIKVRFPLLRLRWLKFLVF